MNSNVSSDRQPHLQNISPRQLRTRAIGQLTAIALLATLVLGVAAVSGCEAVAPASATAKAEPSASTGDKRDANSAQVVTGFDWRHADPVVYSPEDWATDPALPSTF